MGYYTNYMLRVVGPADAVKAFADADPPLDPKYPEFRVSHISDESMKWYDHPDDMLRLSSEWHNLTFVLAGEGEESGDVWRMKFKGGKILQGVKAEYKFPGWREPKGEAWYTAGSSSIHTT